MRFVSGMVDGFRENDQNGEKHLDLVIIRIQRPEIRTSQSKKEKSRRADG